MTKVGRWMTKNPMTIDKDATVIEAIHLMKEKNIRRLPVMDKGKIVGILTEKMVADFKPSKATSLDTWEVHYILSKTPVTEAMNPKPYKVKPDTDLTEAAQLLPRLRPGLPDTTNECPPRCLRFRARFLLTLNCLPHTLLPFPFSLSFPRKRESTLDSVGVQPE